MAFRLALVLALFAGPSAVSAADRADSAEKPQPTKAPGWALKYRFRKGDVFHFHARSNSRMEVTARDITQVLYETRESFKHYRVVEVKKDGSAILQPMIDRAIMKARSDDNPWIIWDSRSSQQVPRRFQNVSKGIGTPTVRVHYSPTGEILEVKATPDKETKKTTRPLPRPGEEEADPNDDKSSYAFLVRLPDEPVVVGESWDDDFIVEVSPEPDLSRKLRKDIDIRRTYTLDNVKNGIAEISFKTFVKKRINDPIIQVQLISRSLTGKVRFDVKRGLILDWSSAGSGEVFNPYGNSSHVESSLQSREVYSTRSLSSSKPVIASGPRGAAGPPRRPKF